MRVSVENDKYTYVFHLDGKAEVLRYGEPWRDAVGDKFIYCMAAEIETLRATLKVLTDALESWKGIAENCSIEAGYCCCGEDMKTHSHPMSCGHSPVDMADGPVSKAMELTYKALDTVKEMK